ncbi:MAG: transporter substrate-binding domain-containing protein [Candidatus Thalassarchaeaceae archaeon]
MNKISVIGIVLLLLASTTLTTVATGEGNQSKDPPTEVEIGFLLDLSSPAISALAPGFLAVANITIDHLNDKQNDYNFQYVTYDSGCSEWQASNAAQDIVDDGVELVVGALCSGASAGANAVLSAAGIPHISPTSTMPALSNWTDYPLFFRVVPSDAAFPLALNATVAADTPANETVALVHSNNYYSSDMADMFSNAYTADGSNLCTQIEYNEWDYNPDDIVETLWGLGCESVVITSYASDSGDIIDALEDNGVAVQIYGGEPICHTGMFNEVSDNSNLDGVKCVKSSDPQLTSVRGQEFSTDCANDSDCAAGIYTAETYDAFSIIAESYILTQIANIDLEDAIRYIGYHWEGASSNITFNSDGDVAGNPIDICEFVSSNASLICQDSYIGEGFDFIPDNELYGYDIFGDNSENLHINFVESSWDGIIPNLNANSGMCDAILSAMTKTDVREEIVDFTRGYYSYSQGVIGADGVDEIEDISEIDVSGTMIGVLEGSTGHLYASHMENVTISRYNYTSDAVNALENGDLDYVFADLLWLVNDMDYEYTIMTVFATEHLGIAVREGETELLDALNVGITTIMDSEIYEDMYSEWFLYDANSFDRNSMVLNDSNGSTASEFPIPTNGSSLSNVLETGELKVCTDPYYPPFESYNAVGDVVGFDVDFGRAVMDVIFQSYNMDSDEDGIMDYLDQFPADSTEWNDTDGDGVGDNSDDDDDGDGVGDSEDAFPYDPSETTDTDGDEIGNNADTDDDNDGLADAVDNCPTGLNEESFEDLFYLMQLFNLGLIQLIEELENGGNLDTDGDGCYNIEDTDDDGDGVEDINDAFPRDSSETSDSDADGVGDNADAFPEDPTEWMDTDGDGVGNNIDAFPTDSNESGDSDNDSFGDNIDVFPEDPTEWMDSDGDGVGDNSDIFPEDSTEWNDTDNDTFGDNSDAFPEDPTEWIDTDGDGFGDNSDSFRYDMSEWIDTDGDGIGDNSDAFPEDPTEWMDSDGDGFGNSIDAFPGDNSEWLDSDGDGFGDNSDIFPENSTEWIDTDNDTFGDNSDAFPEDPTEWMDSDGDGVGDNKDAYPKDPDRTEEGLPGFSAIIMISALVSAAIVYSSRNEIDE